MMPQDTSSRALPPSFWCPGDAIRNLCWRFYPSFRTPGNCWRFSSRGAAEKSIKRNKNSPYQINFTTYKSFKWPIFITQYCYEQKHYDPVYHKQNSTTTIPNHFWPPCNDSGSIQSKWGASVDLHRWTFKNAYPTGHFRRWLIFGWFEMTTW